MKKHGFQSNIQFLTWINKSDSLRHIKTDSQREIDEYVSNYFQIITSSSQLSNKIKNLFFAMRNMKLIHQTQCQFRQILMCSQCQTISIIYNEQSIRNNTKYFNQRLNFSSSLLKAVEEGNYYEAMTLHQQNLQQNGENILLWQKMSNSLFAGLYLSMKFFAQTHVRLPFEWKKWHIDTISQKLFISYSCLMNANCFIKKLILKIQQFMAGKFFILNMSLQSKILTKEKMSEILYFFIWATTKQMIMVEKIKKNRIGIDENLVKLFTQMKQIKYQQSYIDEHFQSFRTLEQKIYETMYLIFYGVYYIS